MGCIAENAKRVLERVAKASLSAGLPEGGVTIVAASKMNGLDAVREAYGAGVRSFGENRVQELEEKLKQGAYNGAALHFIGHLQRNKVKNLVGRVELIQSVDSTELIRLIGARADAQGITQRVLLEVNIAGEESKSGVPPHKLPELLDAAEETAGIRVCGLMAIPPAGLEVRETMLYFARMRKLFIDSGEKKYDNSSMDILSMGMSADYEEAILCGANMVRVGTAIFGRRSYAL